MGSSQNPWPESQRYSSQRNPFGLDTWPRMAGNHHPSSLLVIFSFRGSLVMISLMMKRKRERERAIYRWGQQQKAGKKILKKRREKTVRFVCNIWEDGGIIKALSGNLGFFGSIG